MGILFKRIKWLYKHIEGWFIWKRIGDDPRLWTRSVCAGSDKRLTTLLKGFMDNHGLSYDDMAFDLSWVEVDWYGDIVGVVKVCNQRLSGGVVMPIIGIFSMDSLSSEPYMSLGGVYVVEKFRRNGVGRKLVNRVMDYVGGIGCHWIHWAVSVDYSLGHRFSHGIGAELLYIGGGKAHYLYRSTNSNQLVSI